MKKYFELFLTMFKIGLFTFGGGYAMIALLENEFVEKKKYVGKEEFLDMVAIAESTPGPIAINSATYLGYKHLGFFVAVNVKVLSSSEHVSLIHSEVDKIGAEAASEGREHLVYECVRSVVVN